MAKTKVGAPAPRPKRLPRERLVEFLSEMLLIRRFEEKVTERFRAGELAGFLHACIGQEAVAVGICRALADGDVIASTHRAHGHVLANGTPPNEVMAELYGKVEGCSHGYGGSMHLYDVARGNMGANAVVGGGLPATVGAALAFKLRGEPHVALAFFGDGATNIGTFHESLNLAQLWQVPAVFICENNRWSESTPQSQHQPIKDLTQRAAAYGMHALKVDGQDVEAVHLAALDALAHARAGHGPVFLLCETERLTGHYIGDPQVYRDKDEPRRLRETRDPIQNLREQLALSEKEWARLGDNAQRVVDASVEFAKAGTDPTGRRAQARVRGGLMKLHATRKTRRAAEAAASREEKAMERLVIVTHLRKGTERPYPLEAALDEWRAILEEPRSVARERFVPRRQDDHGAAVPRITGRSQTGLDPSAASTTRMGRGGTPVRTRGDKAPPDETPAVHAWRFSYIGAAGLEGPLPILVGDRQELRKVAETPIRLGQPAVRPPRRLPRGDRSRAFGEGALGSWTSS